MFVTVTFESTPVGDQASLYKSGTHTKKYLKPLDNIQRSMKMASTLLVLCLVFTKHSFSMAEPFFNWRIANLEAHHSFIV